MNVFFRAGVTLFFYLTLLTTHAVDYKIFRAEGKVGLKDHEGNVLIPAEYDGLGWSSEHNEPVDGVIGYRLASAWGLITIGNKQITGCDYSKLYPANSQVFLAARRGRISGYDFLGAINSEGKVVLPFRYASVDIAGSRAIVSNKSGSVLHYGLVDMGGKELIPIRYNEIEKVSHWYAVKDKSGKTGLYDAEGVPRTAFEFDAVDFLAPGYALVKKENAYGLFGKEGKMLLSPTWQQIRLVDGEIELLAFNEWTEIGTDRIEGKKYYHEELIPYGENYKVVSNGRQWLIDKNDTALTPQHYKRLVMGHNGFILFSVRNRWGLMNRTFATIMKARFDSLKLNEALVFARDSYRQWLIFDTLGVKKSSRPYEQIGEKTGYLWPVMRNGYWGFVERSGEEIIRCVYDEVGEFVDGKVVVGFHGENGIIDKKGDWVIYPQRSELQLLTDDLYLSKLRNLTTLKSIENGTIYFTENEVEIKENYLLEKLAEGGIWKIDFSGQIQNNDPRDERFEEIRRPSEGFYPVRIDGLYGFIDSRNRLRIANRYEDVGPFKEDLAAFRLLGKWGFIDKSERIRVQPLYEEVHAFNDGLAVVKTGQGYGIINKEGKKLSTVDYDRLVKLGNGKWLVEKDSRYGMIDKDGRPLINIKYQYLQDLDNDCVIIKKRNKYGLITNDGVDILPALYDRLIYDAVKNVYLGMKKSTWVKAEL